MAQFNDDDLKIAIQQLRPHTNWPALITTALAVAAAVWAMTQYIGDTVKRGEIKPVTDDIMRIRLEMPTMNGRIERVEASQSRMEKTIDRVEGKIDDASRKRR